MKCNQCEGKLTEYIEGHLSTEEDEEIRNHILTCDSCKTQYDIEVLQHKAFNESFSDENVNFQNSTDKIMNKIDKNRYVRGRVKMKRKFRGKLVVAAAFLLGIIVTAAVMGTMGNRGLLSSLLSSNDGSNKTAKSSASNDTTKSSENQLDQSSKTETAVKDSNEAGANNGVAAATVEMYSKAEVSTSKELKFNTPFIATEDAKYEASIEGKGETAGEEGTGKLYIKDTVGNKMYEYSVIDNNTQNSPLSISWYDNNNLMIIHGGAYGTLVNGVNIIILDVTTGEQTLVATAGDKERYKSIARSGNDLVLKYVLYIDDAMNEFNDKEKVISNYVLGDVIE